MTETTHKMNRRLFLNASVQGATGLAAGTALVSSAQRTGAADDRSAAKAAIDVGTGKQLFIDKRFVQISEGIHLTMGHPQKTRERLLWGDRPWEDCAVGGGSVVKDEDGSFKMWYAATHGPRKGEGTSKLDKLCFATSTDGVHWEKPSLGLVEFRGSKDNNIVLTPQSMGWGGCVFRDPTAQGDEKYKLLYGDKKFPFKAPKPYGTYGKICGATSPDGIHWRPLPENPIMPWYKDTQTAAFWDDRIKKYVAFLRDNDWKNYSRFRRICRSETEDFKQWPRPKLVLAPDDDDPLDTDLYTSAAIKYPYASNVYLMFPSVFYHKHDTLDIQLAVSRDGVRWQRAGGREPFMRLGRNGQFDSMMLYVAVGITRTGDELSLYHSGCDVGHGAFNYQMRNVGVFSRAVLRLDGFISAHADYQGGTLTTPPLLFSGTRLQLNVDTGAGGFVKVEILDANGRSLDGFTKADADSINGNDVQRTVTWKGRSNLSSLQRKPIRLRFSMRDAGLYAFQFQKQA